jgi:hypothetical protein
LHRFIGGLVGLGLIASTSLALAGPIKIVAAENVYGDIAKQIGGPNVTVTSILSNPDQDPHLFEVSPSVARDVSAAGILIYNGIDYDPVDGKTPQGRPLGRSQDNRGRRSGREENGRQPAYLVRPINDVGAGQEPGTSSGSHGSRSR